MSRTEAEILDDKEAILVLDRSGLFKDEFDFPQNLRKAVANVKAFGLPESVRVGRRTIRYKNVENIVLAGMGGSAIVGDVLKDWIGTKSPFPWKLFEDIIFQHI